MRRTAAALALVALCLVAGVLADAPRKSKTLVVLDNLDQRTTHSQFFAALRSSGYDLTYMKADDSNLKIASYGVYLYDNIILFSPRTESFGGDVDAEAIIAFIDSGRNVLFAANSELGEAMREIASSCGVDFDEAGATVIDHINFDETDNDGAHDLIVAEASQVLDNAIICGAPTKRPLLWRGIGQALDADNELVFPILHASSTAYSANPRETLKELPHVSGTDTVLISAIQARNNARAVFSGSLDFFSDEFFESQAVSHAAHAAGKKAESSGNAALAVAVAQWAFLARGELRVREVHHAIRGQKTAPSVYRINDEIDFSLIVEEWSNGKWQPHNADNIQLEFVMLDPYIRTTLKSVGNGKYATSFKAPDVYGVFTFRVHYVRKGYTGVYIDLTHPVRPMRHDEYERFIHAAGPYYVAVFSIMIGLFIFSAAFLFNRSG